MSKKKVIVIGAGLSGISTACYLAKAGYDVQILEKNAEAGGRVRQYKRDGFTFDMGPTWYWMPDVFEKFFNDFGKSVKDYYELIRLDPSYNVYFDDGDILTLPSSHEELRALFEEYEPGSAVQLDRFLEDAEYKYNTGMNEFVYKPSRSLMEFMDFRLIKAALSIGLFTNYHKYIRKYFKHPKLIQILEFPILLLGSTPQHTPSLYSLMTYADLKLGSWYPVGGMYKIIEAMTQVAKDQGVQIHCSTTVERIEINNKKATKVHCADGRVFDCDIVIGGADYHHVEQKLLEPQYRNYTEAYWDKKQMAPSCLLYYVGLNKKIENFPHHALFFDESFDQHAAEIYDNPQWPKKPLFYTCCSTKSDPTTAPEGHENLFLLIPVAAGIEDTEEIREHYFNLLMDRMEKHLGQDIRPNVIFKDSYAQSDFIRDYNSYKGNAYGLANTLFQTAIFRPTLKNKKVSNMYFTGQLTVPGPGMPPSIISGNVVAHEVIKEYPL